MTEINPEHLATRIAQFRDERRALQEMVVACFPIASKVRQKSTDMVGSVFGTVHGHCDLLTIKFPHHTWIVDATDLERFDEPY